MADFFGPKNQRQKTAHMPSRSAYVGDEVFFHRGGQPVSGRVLCTGKHGCTVESEGKQHKVKWSDLAGHKKRAMQRYHVVEEGEDGLIVQDANGKRRYVGIPPESRDEKLRLTTPARAGA